MTEQERRALAVVEATSSIDGLRRVLVDAKGRSDAVYRAAFTRLVQVSASDHADPVVRAYWEMVHTIEQIRREAGRKVWRMHRLRPKIEREGERSALEYCARNKTDGFGEVLGYGLPEFTAEAIVLRFPEAFSAETLTIARERLISAEVDVAAAIAR